MKTKEKNADASAKMNKTNETGQKKISAIFCMNLMVGPLERPEEQRNGDRNNQKLALQQADNGSIIRAIKAENVVVKYPDNEGYHVGSTRVYR